VCLTPEVNNAKTCCVCGAEFTPERSTKKYCRDACRMTAALKRESGQRMSRRNYRFRLLNRSRALGFDGKHTGPVPDGVPSLGELNLRAFPAVLHV
jgi:hypothetical protein